MANEEFFIKIGNIEEINRRVNELKNLFRGLDALEREIRELRERREKFKEEVIEKIERLINELDELERNLPREEEEKKTEDVGKLRKELEDLRESLTSL
ncbi:MAG: hypothetical protein OH319_00945 [Candidatus Parvarchaeota archaeon]|nr:hypothetical protein [Candidatus Jingweiarchaeum tengchongense]MCW1297857.1 hypothetical protein [Candidatus Jingweiarchaeum tengchongense]MCW1299868.1 hypothetical protein [Candidatus Jingweiarchaeum tengchongense]MCW1304162.1 hypothetical protein [Candidatus Jingweiarchaeum tengchongense]MCW1305190.1 hypothetical protein [Candidatus Jingweiarchaeum tengchongense]